MRDKCPACREIINLDQAEIKIQTGDNDSSYYLYRFCPNCDQELLVHGEKLSAFILLGLVFLFLFLGIKYGIVWLVAAVAVLLFQEHIMSLFIKVECEGESHEVLERGFPKGLIFDSWVTAKVSQEGISGKSQVREITDNSPFCNFHFVALVLMKNECSIREENEYHQKIVQSLEESGKAVVVTKYLYGNRLRWHVYSYSRSVLNKRLVMLSRDIEITWGIELDDEWKEYQFMFSATNKALQRTSR